MSHIVYRRATENEIPSIRALLQEAHLDIDDMRAADTLVAEEEGEIVGTNRLKRYADGAVEIGSAFVVPDHRKLGINRHLTELLRDESEGPLYLITSSQNEQYVGHLGFLPITDLNELPESIRRKHTACSCAPWMKDPRVYKWVRVPEGD